MMKIILPVIIIIAVGILLWNKVFTPVSNKVISTPQTTQVKNQVIKESSPSGKYTLDIEYPQVGNAADLEITKIVDGIKDNFLAEVKTSQPIPDLKDALASLTVRYDVCRSDDKFVSTPFNIEDYQVGMAHPDNFVEAFNFDLSNNKVLQLSDIFTKNADYLNLLSKLTSEKLTNQYKDDPNASDFIKSGTAPKQENFQNFCLTKDDLVIIFNPALVAPYVDGIQKVSIPWKDLGDTLSQKF